jgi:hypothetical protein
VLDIEKWSFFVLGFKFKTIGAGGERPFVIGAWVLEPRASPGRDLHIKFLAGYFSADWHLIKFTFLIAEREDHRERQQPEPGDPFAGGTS